MKPGLHSQSYEPGVLRQRPCRHMRGFSKHSSTSGKKKSLIYPGFSQGFFQVFPDIFVLLYQVLYRNVGNPHRAAAAFWTFWLRAALRRWGRTRCSAPVCVCGRSAIWGSTCRGVGLARRCGAAWRTAGHTGLQRQRVGGVANEAVVAAGDLWCRSINDALYINTVQAGAESIEIHGGRFRERDNVEHGRRQRHGGQLALAAKGAVWPAFGGRHAVLRRPGREPVWSPLPAPRPAHSRACEKAGHRR